MTMRGNIAYTMKKLKDNNIYARTYVQKILYFTLPENEKKEYFIPYLYGPYSEGIQRVMQYLEFSQEKLEAWKDEVDEDLKDKIDRIINYILSNKMSVRDIARFSKLHYFINTFSLDLNNLDDDTLKEFLDYINKKSIILGWKDDFKGLTIENLKDLIGKLKDFESKCLSY